jgi:Ca2+-binding EF-hand superfamily protein
VSAKKAQLAAQSATADAKATKSDQDIIDRRGRFRGFGPNPLRVGGANGIEAMKTSDDVESFCLMPYEGTAVTEARIEVQEPHHEEQKEEESKKKLMLAHFAHALAQVFGGSSSEAAFMSKSAFALDKLFRSFGRSKPGRGMLNFPEFAGALRHIVSQHDMDKRYVEADVVADLFMFCDGDSDGFVRDVELRDFLLQHRRARRRKMRQTGRVARRKQVPRFRGPPTRRGKYLPRARVGPQRKVKVAPGLGLNRGVRGGGVRGRRRRKPLGAGGQVVSNHRWKQQRDMARRQARNKAASVNTLHVQCAPVARRLLAAQTLQGWATAFCRYDRTRARCMQWREVRGHC